VAKRSGDTAFGRASLKLNLKIFRPHQNGVALACPPHSKTSRKSGRAFNDQIKACMKWSIRRRTTKNQSIQVMLRLLFLGFFVVPIRLRLDFRGCETR
jgi:hypothetical protein